MPRTAHIGLKRWWLIALALLAWTAAIAPADDVRDLLEEALDQQVAEIHIADLPLRDALVLLEEHTGVPIRIDDDVLQWMPYGARTRVTLTIEDLGLRDGLERLLDSLGLRMEVRDDYVALRPAPALDRLGRRMTIREVGLLGVLASGPWETLGRDQPALRFEFEAGGPAPDRSKEFIAELEATQAPTALRQLELATRALDLVWTLSEGGVLIRTRLGDVQARLDRTLDMSYHTTPLDELLLDVGRRIGVLMYFEPGVLQQVAARDRTVDLIQRGASVRQTLELISGNTGLRYDVADDGVHFAGPQGQSADQPIAKSPRLFKLTLPIGSTDATFDVILREDDLPAPLRSWVGEKIDELLHELADEAAADD